MSAKSVAFVFGQELIWKNEVRILFPLSSPNQIVDVSLFQVIFDFQDLVTAYAYSSYCYHDSTIQKVLMLEFHGHALYGHILLKCIIISLILSVRSHT